jgi:hypothetical protein
MYKRGITVTLDQSLSSCGFALYGEGLIASGAWSLCRGVEDRAEGYRQLFGKLDAIHKEHHILQLVHETIAFGAVNKGQDQLLAAAGLVATIELFAKSRSLLAPVAYQPKQWRGTFFSRDERAALKGKSWKHPAILRCRQLGLDPVTSDEAEAIGILDHHLGKLKVMPDWRRKAGFMLDPVA